MAKITDLSSVPRTTPLKTLLTPDAHTLDIRSLCNITLAIPDWQKDAFDIYKDYELSWYQDSESLKHTKDRKKAKTLNVEKVHARTGKSLSKVTNRDIEANIVLDWGRKLVNTSMVIFMKDLQAVGELQGMMRRLQVESVLKHEVIMKVEVMCLKLGHKVDIGGELERLRPRPEDRVKKQVNTASKKTGKRRASVIGSDEKA